MYSLGEGDPFKDDVVLGPLGTLHVRGHIRGRRRVVCGTPGRGSGGPTCNGRHVSPTQDLIIIVNELRGGYMHVYTRSLVGFM